MWDKMLADFDDKTIRKALDECPHRFTWMPEIAEFLQLCKAMKGSQENQFYKSVNENGKRSEFVSPLLEEYCAKNNLQLPGVIKRNES